MTRPTTSSRAAVALAALIVAACSATAQQPIARAEPPSPAAIAKADSGRPAYTRADVTFMQGMIGHHAQAITMAALAPKNGASRAVGTLAERIDVSQRDEIAYMQRWLRERRETVPDPSARHEMAGHDMMNMDMPGMLMPGMLTHEQMMQLESAKGAEFDRLFLTFMIQHHTGALTMVDALFASPGAGQDVSVFRFASDVTADQTTEIDRMRSMLASPQRTSP